MLSISSEWDVIKLIEGELKHSKTARREEWKIRLKEITRFAEEIQHRMDAVNIEESRSNQEVCSEIRTAIHDDVTALCKDLGELTSQALFTTTI